MFEWRSQEAIEAAHENAVVRAMWEEYEQVGTYRPIGEVPEAVAPFPEIAPLA